jgi:hypothetical protein
MNYIPTILGCFVAALLILMGTLIATTEWSLYKERKREIEQGGTKRPGPDCDQARK